MNTPGTFIGYLSFKSQLEKFMPTLGVWRVGACVYVCVFRRVNINMCVCARRHVCMWCPRAGHDKRCTVVCTLTGCQSLSISPNE